MFETYYCNDYSNSHSFLAEILKQSLSTKNDYGYTSVINDNGLVITFNVPGVKTEDIEASYENFELNLKVKNNIYKYSISKNWNLDDASAKHEYGQFVITIPKAASKKNIIKIL